MSNLNSDLKLRAEIAEGHSYRQLIDKYVY